MKFIELTLGSHMVCHGFDENNKEILERVDLDGFSKKLVAVSRIKSVSEKYVLIDCLDGRWVYWEYEDGYETVKNLLNS
ncbi:hypothetical protein [Neotamlana laminarinivorans]|uniref:Uncharacterized protein n=1 Tax=Neotamlana laminarinivorans TaxID=2883124 RepID=A0A9X1L1F3_9FLAO|nr:hypothetical protein [Tamlana laminarinivorans]MCB4798615.1 hypothetical protein [Tamlana laminarinivorans]